MNNPPTEDLANALKASKKRTLIALVSDDANPVEVIEAIRDDHNLEHQIITDVVGKVQPKQKQRIIAEHIGCRISRPGFVSMDVI